MDGMDQLLEKFLNAREENFMACGCVGPYKTVCYIFQIMLTMLRYTFILWPYKLF